MLPSSVPKSFLFGAFSSKSSSKSSSKQTTTKPPRLSSQSKQETSLSSSSSSSGSPKVEIRGRSASVAEPGITRPRRGTLSATVDHLTSFWEGKSESKKKEKNEIDPCIDFGEAKEMTGKTTKDSKDKDNKDSEKGVLTFKEYTREADIEMCKQVRSDKTKKSPRKDKDKDKDKDDYPGLSPRVLTEPIMYSRKLNSREANKELSKDIFEAVKGLKEMSPSKEIKKSHEILRVPVEVSEREKLRVKHKARSEGSLIAAIFSKKLVEKGPLQKSSSLIELKPLMNPTSGTSKSSSAILFGTPTKSAGYFGITIEEAMAMQKEKYFDLSIPVIMVKLTDAILLNDGCKTEGIFRVAGSTMQVLKTQQQFNDLNFDEIPSDPHVLVGVLKQWLRELKEPLIPNANYHNCLNCESLADCVSAIDKLPALNKATLGKLVQLLREIAKPENQQYTKMDMHSICLVSAPVLFRCQSTDMAELVVNMQREKAFLGLVLESSAFSCSIFM